MKIQGLLLGIFLSLTMFAQNWDSLSGGINRYPTKMFWDTVTDKFYVAGTFSRVDGKQIYGIASWDGSRWDSLAHGIDFYDTLFNSFPASTWAMVRYGNHLYCGGTFTKAGTIPVRTLARWDGTVWDSVPGAQFSQNESIADIDTNNNELYICGAFDSVGNVPANAIAKWDGVTWHAIGPNYDFLNSLQGIQDMAFYHGNLYVGGFFKDPQNNTCRLAKWDGSNWQFMTNDLQGSLALVGDMEVFNNELYVSGLFYSSTGNAGTSIMRWNDTTWRDVGGSVQVLNNAYPQIADMCVNNGKLYCVGNFESIGGINATYAAVWDGVQWCGFGSTFDNTVGQVAFYHDTMFVGGGFWNIDAANIRFIAEWKGGNYVDTCGAINTGINQHNNQNSSWKIFPNPANEFITIQLNNSNEESVEIKIIDVFGQTVIEKKEEPISENFNKQIDISSLSTGIYLIIIRTSEKEFTQKIIVQ